MEEAEILWIESEGSTRYVLWEEAGKLRIGVFYMFEVEEVTGECEPTPEILHKYLARRIQAGYMGQMRFFECLRTLFLCYEEAWASIPKELQTRLKEQMVLESL